MHAIAEDKHAARDFLLTMANLAREFTLEHLFLNLDDFIKLVKTDSVVATEIFDQGFVTTPQSRKIVSIECPSTLTTKSTFAAATGFLTNKEVELTVS